MLGWAARLLSAGLVAVASFLAAALVVLFGIRLFYAGTALPGVALGGLEVGGLSAPEIETTLAAHLPYPQTGRLVLRDGERIWSQTPAGLGAVLDTPSMSAASLAVGRSGDLLTRFDEQLRAWFTGVNLAPILVLDERSTAAYLDLLAGQIDVPTIEAGVLVQGRDVTVQPGQIGRQLDRAAALEAVAAAVATMTDTVIELPVVETPPAILDASAQADVARRLLSGPLTVVADGVDPWTFQPDVVAGLIQFRRIDDAGAARLVVGLDEAWLLGFLEQQAPGLVRQPENARFIFNDDTRQLDLLVPAVIGRSLDVPGSVEAVQRAVGEARREVALVFHETAPEVGSDATAESLGISENVVAVSTYFAGSSAERRQNIATAAAEFHGLLVPPGATFSMAEHMGDISLDNGYAEALIIFGNRTINGVGGGVCQVSTTLFRAVFFGGFPIVERHPHAYRVGYYEQGTGSAGPGMDATVFLPLVDFRFTNDTPYWLLMETYIYGNQLLWKFYSTSDGRTVQWSSDRSNEVKAPKPIYRENEDLPEGKIEQVDFQAHGLDVVVYRTVRRDGQVLIEDRIKTHYLPWRAIYEFGPGTELPEGANVDD